MVNICSLLNDTVEQIVRVRQSTMTLNFLLKYRWKSMPFHVRLYTSAGMYSISNDHCTKFCSIEVSLEFTTLAIRLMNLNHCQHAEIKARTVCTRISRSIALQKDLHQSRVG